MIYQTVYFMPLQSTYAYTLIIHKQIEREMIIQQNSTTTICISMATYVGYANIYASHILLTV